tara:strand:- start:374 stop:940 length:567 start_codon:yes stop_codon:yes gene_type:complete
MNYRILLPVILLAAFGVGYLVNQVTYAEEKPAASEDAKDAKVTPKDLSQKSPAELKEHYMDISDKEWKQRLTEEEYRVLRKAGTEPAFSSPLNDIKEPGTFVCAACGNELYKTEHKYESGTGWPSFYQPAGEGAIETSLDFKLIYPRTEVHCARCGGHLGHVFKDGPEPTGLRYCMNGVAMNFTPKPE